MELTDEEFDWLWNKLKEEARNPDPKRLKRLREAQENAKKMKEFL
jgi:hypothetical protein